MRNWGRREIRSARHAMGSAERKAYDHELHFDIGEEN